MSLLNVNHLQASNENMYPRFVKQMCLYANKNNDIREMPLDNMVMINQYGLSLCNNLNKTRSSLKNMAETIWKDWCSLPKINDFHKWTHTERTYQKELER